MKEMERRSFLGRLAAAAVGLLACFVPGVSRPRPAVLSVEETDHLLDGLSCHVLFRGGQGAAVDGLVRKFGRPGRVSRAWPRTADAQAGRDVGADAWGGNYALVPVNSGIGQGVYDAASVPGWWERQLAPSGE